MILSRLDRYIGRRIAVSTLWVLAVLLALFVFFAFIDALDDYGRGSFGLYELLRYALLSQPRRLYEILPVAAVIGASVGLSSLALSAELIAMRAAGLSPGRIVGAAMKTALAFAAAGVLAGEYVVPAAESYAQLTRAQALQTAVQRQSGIWLRDGRDFVSIGQVLSDMSLLGVHVYHAEGEGRLDRQIYARHARFEDGLWRLQDVRESRVGVRGVTVRHAPEQTWRSTITPEVVVVFAVRPEALSIQQLGRFIEHLERNNQDTRRYRLVFWQKTLLPLAVAVMVLAATPFVFRPVRSGGLSQRAFIGVMLGLAFVIVQRSLGHLGLLYGAPPWLAAGLPVLGFFLLALGLLRRVAK
jgi:lipopolysaccharide export system permease protein